MQFPILFAFSDALNAIPSTGLFIANKGDTLALPVL